MVRRSARHCFYCAGSAVDGLPSPQRLRRSTLSRSGEGGGALAGCRAEGVADAKQDVVQALADLLVGDAEDDEALGLDLAGAGRVVERSIGLLPAVDLDDEFCGETEKVGGVGAERDLAAPFRAGETSAAKLLPERVLGRGLVVP